MEVVLLTLPPTWNVEASGVTSLVFTLSTVLLE